MRSSPGEFGSNHYRVGWTGSLSYKYVFHEIDFANKKVKWTKTMMEELRIEVCPEKNISTPRVLFLKEVLFLLMIDLSLLFSTYSIISFQTLIVVLSCFVC